MRHAVGCSTGSHLGRGAAIFIGFVGASRRDESIQGILADEEAVVLLGAATEALEKNTEKDDAYARAGEHAPASNVPGRRDEARIDGVPVPEHL